LLEDLAIVEDSYLASYWVVELHLDMADLEFAKASYCLSIIVIIDTFIAITSVKLAIEGWEILLKDLVQADLNIGVVQCLD